MYHGKSTTLRELVAVGCRLELLFNQKADALQVLVHPLFVMLADVAQFAQFENADCCAHVSTLHLLCLELPFAYLFHSMCLDQSGTIRCKDNAFTDVPTSSCVRVSTPRWRGWVTLLPRQELVLSS